MLDGHRNHCIRASILFAGVFLLGMSAVVVGVAFVVDACPELAVALIAVGVVVRRAAVEPPRRTPVNRARDANIVWAPRAGLRPGESSLS